MTHIPGQSMHPELPLHALTMLEGILTTPIKRGWIGALCDYVIGEGLLVKALGGTGIYNMPWRM